MHFKQARENFEPSRPLRLVHSADAVEADAERLTAEMKEATQAVHRALERKLQTASDYEAAILVRDRKAHALELVIRIMGRK